MKKIVLWLTTAVLACGCVFASSCKKTGNSDWKIVDITDNSVPKDYEMGFGKGVTFTYSGPDNWYAPASLSKNLEVWREVENRTGVKVTWDVKASNEWNQSMMMRINSGSTLPDIIGLPNWQNGDIDRFAREGVIIPLNQLINEYAPNIKKFLKENPEVRKQMTAPDGGIYSIDEVFSANEYYKSIIIRKDWLAKCGYAEGWVPTTKAEFTEVLGKFKTVTTKYSSTAPVQPMLVVDGEDYEFLASAMGLSVPLQDTVIDENGKAVYQRATVEYGEYLTWMNELYNVGCISADYETGNRSNMEMYIARDQIGMTVAEGDIMHKYNKILESSGIDGEYIMINPPVDENGDLTLVKRILLGGQISITSYCDDPITAIRWMDYLWASEEGNLLLHYGIEGKSYTMVDGKPKFTDFVLNNPDGLDPASALRTLGAWGPLFDRQTKDFIEAIYPQQVIDYVAGNVEKGLYVNPFPKIIGTKQELDSMASISTAINTYQSENSMLFILGKLQTSKYENYVRALENLGLKKYEQKREAQYERFSAL